ncbi:MAG: PKD-like domain-containing protein [Haliscomenobacter sp.]|uniref:PKD-like domain-containing protein n=1 Tax=Haliscomenobacter sp. TaxID=2717303 RepID=UPI0029AF75D2|nr:PKD-like domain-containing protein [Haliscomenobacter sp.]MDX2066859.1 PKD-like domain-containing protein [Haliscomenobacter sp.]
MNTMIQKLCILLSACLIGGFLSAQVPSISSFAPSSGPIGSSVTITGTNFNTIAANNVVYFGPVKATVNAATATTLTVTVPVGTNYQPITVLNTVSGLRAQSTLPFKVTFSSGLSIDAMSFAAKVDSVTATRPSGLATGDMDGNGKPDLVIAHSVTQSIRIYRNNSTGNAVSFSPRFNLTLNAGATGVAVDDLDGDGKLDIAATSSTASKVFLFRNTSSGNEMSFAARIDSSAGGAAQAVAVGDLDRDGKPDLAIANSSAGTISVLRNTSKIGTLSFASKITFTVGSQPFTLAIGDIDGDGKLDIVAGNAQNSTISVLRNISTSGNINFAAKVDFDAGSFPFGTTLGDIDGDGKLDVLVVDQGIKLTILRNTSKVDTVRFASKVDFTTGTTPIRISVGDLDGDGKAEVAVSNNATSTMTPSTVSIFKNNSTNGNISLAPKVDLATGAAPFANVIVDLTGDNIPDFAVVNQNANTVSVFRTTFDLPPAITSFSPMTGGPGDTITITGNNLTGATKVSFGDTAASFFQVVSPLIIKAVVGVGASGEVAVIVRGDTLTLPGFVFTDCPTTFVFIDAIPGDTICPGDSIRFEANALVADSTATFEWYLNGDLVGTDTILTIDTLAHLDTIICIVRDTCSMPVSDSDTLIVHLKTLPVLTSTLSPPAVCSGTSFAYTSTTNVPGTTFQWRRKAVPGISNPASTGMGPISETLNDTTANPVMVTYEFFNLSAGGCLQPDTFRIQVVVNPIPKLTSPTAQLMQCTGTPFTYTPSSSTTGTTITWTRAFVNGVSNSGSMGTGAISETLNNSGDTSVTVTYVFALIANGCSNPMPPTLKLKVSPIPQVTSSLTPPAICSGANFSYIPISNRAGATFNWTRAAVTGISNAARTDTGRINEILSNTTTNPVNVVYQYTATLGGCTSPTPVNVTVTVNPSPLLSSTLTPTAICSGTPFVYPPTSSSSNVTFTWTRAAVNGISNAAKNGTGAARDTLVNTTADTVTVIYAYTVSASGCSDPNPRNVTLRVKPIPRLNSSLTPPAICSGTSFSYTPSSATEGTTFTWSRTVVSGISNAAASGTGNPNEALVNTTNGPINVVYAYSLSAAGCANPAATNVTVLVNQPPALSSSSTPPAICSGTVFSYNPTSAIQGTTFTWTRAAVNGISNAAATGTGNPNETLTNTTGLPIGVTYVYTLSANGCSNPQTFNVVVSVKPFPTLISEINPPAICSGSTFNYTPLSGSFDATFNWTRAAVNGISNVAANGTAEVSEILENTTTAAINVVYAFTITSADCSNPNPVNITVSVKPSPRLTSSVNVPAICSGSTFSYSPSSNLANTTFAWTRNAVEGISNTASSGNGAINETLTNEVTFPLSAIYRYTLTANGCSTISPSIVELSINPLPTLTSTTIAPDICSGTLFSYLPKSSTQGTSFTWTRAAVSGISTPATSGTGNPAEVLTNTTNGPVTVVYVYRLSANNCSNPVGYNVEVEVNPLPTLTSASSVPAICSGQIFTYTPTSSVPNTTFSWTRAIVNGISNVAGNGMGNPNETLTNTGSTPVNVTYVYTLNVDGCVNTTTYNVTVTVNPKPTLSSTINPPAICSGSTFAYTPTSATTGATFSWSRAAVNGISNASANGSGNPNEILTNTTSSPINVTYVYLLSANSCANTISNSVVVTVNPQPSLSSDLALAGSCSGTSFTYTPTSATLGTTFSWSRAAVSGINNAAANGFGPITETLTNSTNAAITVSYVFTLSANACTNPATFTVNKSIDPIPTFNGDLNPAAICSGTAFAYTPSSNVAGTQFTWTRAAVNGISNAAASGSGNINENLLNTSSGSLNVVYQYALSANGCNNPNNAQVTVTVNAKPVLITNNPAPRCTSLVDLREAAITAGSSTGLTLTYWRDAATTLPFANPQGADAGVYFIKGTIASTGCFDVKPVTVVIGRIPDAVASGKTICSGIPADITVLNPNAAPGATFNWTATYGVARVGLGSGSGVPFGVNAIDELLVNLTRKRTEVTYTITPVGSQAAGCIGEPITVVVKVNSMGKRCPEAEPTAFRETIPHNTAPQIKVNQVKPKKRKKYLVQAISNPDSVDGVSEAPYTRPRGSVFEENVLKNRNRQAAVVVYTIVPYTNGPNWRDNNGTGDDVLGASFDVVVTVQGAPGFRETELPEIASQPKELVQKQSSLDKPLQTQKPIAPALLDYMVEAAQQPEAEKVVLLQNVPNPFQGNTQIGFYLPEASQTKLTVRDVKGAVLYQIQGEYNKGWNLLNVEAAALRGSGVLYYSLETAKFVETKRMVLLK